MKKRKMIIPILLILFIGTGIFLYTPESDNLMINNEEQIVDKVLSSISDRWDYFPNLSDRVLSLEETECISNKTIINLTEEVPEDFWDINLASDILIYNNEEDKYYNFNLTNFTKENQTGYIDIDRCLSENYTIVYGVEQ